MPEVVSSHALIQMVQARYGVRRDEKESSDLPHPLLSLKIVFAQERHEASFSIIRFRRGRRLALGEMRRRK